MRILWGQDLVNELHRLANEVRKRLWIASPFVGTWENVQAILGSEWSSRRDVSMRLLTDTSSSAQYLDPETLLHFRKKGEIRNIPGLHAKIYIADDSALITSANLTGLAFTSRYEVGLSLSGEGSQQVIDLYENWWMNHAENVPQDWAPKVMPRAARAFEEEPLGKGLPVRFALPPLLEKPNVPRKKDSEARAIPGSHAGVLLTPAEYQKLDELLPRHKNRGRRKVLDALMVGPKTWQELDHLVPRGRTPDTAARYGPHGYPVWVTDRLNAQLDGQIPLFIENKSNKLFRLVRSKD